MLVSKLKEYDNVSLVIGTFIAYSLYLCRV